MSGSTDNTIKSKTEKESPKIRAMDNMEEKDQYQKSRCKSNLNFGISNIDYASTRRASIVDRQYSKTSKEFSPEDDNSKKYFRKLQSKTTLILFGIVLIFLFCNIPRLGVKIFHIYYQGRRVQKHFNACAAAGRYHAPVAILIMGKNIRI